MKNNVVPCVYAELQDLYRWLEEDFHPLKLSQRMSSPISFMADKKDLKQYVGAIQDITIMRLIKQVRQPSFTVSFDVVFVFLHVTFQISQVYTTIEIERFAALAPFAERFHLERVIVDAAKALELQVREPRNVVRFAIAITRIISTGPHRPPQLVAHVRNRPGSGAEGGRARGSVRAEHAERADPQPVDAHGERPQPGECRVFILLVFKRSPIVMTHE